jgi:hypothetical protein
MADPTLEERLARYGSSLDGARRRGVVPARPSVARRLVPAISFVTAFAAVIAAVVLIPRDADAPDRLRPADVAAAEAEIREVFALWGDASLQPHERLRLREQHEDLALAGRSTVQWNWFENSIFFGPVVVDRVAFISDTRAEVDFRVRALETHSRMFPGGAVLQDGHWRVSFASVCAMAAVSGTACALDDFLTEEQQAIGQPFVNIAWSELPDDQRVRDIEGGSEIRDEILDSVNRHRNMLGAKTQLIAVRHRSGEETARVWWTVGTVQPGIAVLDGDRWTISRETWCKLSQNAGEYPPACGEPAPTTTSTAVTTTTTTPSVEPFTYEVDGQLVRGATVRLTLRGLKRLAGEKVELAFSDGLPDEGLFRSRDPAGAMGSGVVDDTGSLVVTSFIPNRLGTVDGSHEYPTVETAKPYDFFVVVGDFSTIWYRATIQIDAAAIGTTYASWVVNNRGTVACGAPPFEVQFDGRYWIPDDGSAFTSEPDRFPGTFTLLSDSTARFTFDDGRMVPFTQSDGWFC